MSVATHGVAAKHVSFERDRGVYRITVTDGLAHVVVKVSKESDRQSQVLSIFRRLADAHIPVFLVKLHRAAVTFAIEAEKIPDVENCISDLNLGLVSSPDVALISIIASSMRELSGILVSIADSLQRAGVRLIAVGDSHNSVQCLVDGSRIDDAVCELKETFGLNDEIDGIEQVRTTTGNE